MSAATVNTTANTSVFDQQKAEGFAERVCQMLDSGAVLAMISVGHRSGLIDAMASLPPATSEAIAATADLAERCVREWLAVMVTGHIIEYEPVSRTYRLPAEHAACLTSGAPLGNLAVYAQHVTLIGQIQDQVLECFNSGKGMAYAYYPHFHEIMAEDSGQTVGRSSST